MEFEVQRQAIDELRKQWKQDGLICIFHSNDGHAHCDDGFTAAWIVEKALTDLVDYIPGVYGQSPDFDRLKDSHVLLVDFSYGEEDIKQMVEICESVTVFDHHITAQKVLEPLMESGDINGYFAVNRSGAGLTWDMLMDKPRPKMIDYIEDRDLWRNVLPHSAEVSAAVRSYPKFLYVWDNMMLSDPAKIAAEGVHVRRNMERLVDEACSRFRLVKFRDRKTNNSFLSVPAVNTIWPLASDVGNVLADDAQFAAVYWQTADGDWQFSLRSKGDKYDVSELAKAFGGGGHRNAAGFRVKKLEEAFIE